MKSLLLATTLLFSSMAFSQVSGSGQISIGNGQTTIGISVGNQNPNQGQLVSRVIMLEQAVRDLQMQVYNLSQTDMPKSELFECSVAAFGDKFYEQAETMALARSLTKKSCERKNHEMHCKNVACEQLR